MNGSEHLLVLRSDAACQLSQVVAECVDHRVRRREFPSEPRDNRVLCEWLWRRRHLYRHRHRHHPLSHRSFLGRRYWPRRHHCFSNTTPEMLPTVYRSRTQNAPNGILHSFWSFNGRISVKISEYEEGNRKMKARVGSECGGFRNYLYLICDVRTHGTHLSPWHLTDSWRGKLNWTFVGLGRMVSTVTMWKYASAPRPTKTVWCFFLGQILHVEISEPRPCNNTK